MNYVNAQRTRDYNKPVSGQYLVQITNVFICVPAVTLQLSVAAFPVNAGILPPPFCVTRISSLKQLLWQVRIERLAHTKP